MVLVIVMVISCAYDCNGCDSIFDAGDFSM